MVEIGDQSTVVIARRAAAESVLQHLIAQAGQKRCFVFADETLDKTILRIFVDPALSKFKYVLVLDDGELPPSTEHVELLESIERENLDVVNGTRCTLYRMELLRQRHHRFGGGSS